MKSSRQGIEGSNHRITRTDPAGITYQLRALLDGSRWEVLKNFRTAEVLRSRLNLYARNVLFEYWAAVCSAD